MPRPKTWRERIAKAKPAKTVTLEKPFAGVPAGQRLYIPSPQVIADWLAAVPPGQTRTPETMRADLARTAGADAACPVATAYSLRMVAEAALEDLRAGQDSAAVVPFWRVVAPGLAAGRETQLRRRRDRASPRRRSGRLTTTRAIPLPAPPALP